YYRKKDWFSGGFREDIPLKHVTSVRIGKKRHIREGIIFILLGLITIPILIGIIPLVFGIYFLWGFPTVVINTAGHDLSGSMGLPWQTKDAEEFVDVVRNQIFKE
ncbi:MAG: hypothetical protein LRZ92_04520, partial [Methanosarcinaceae archaeon]|nr:hypothetical protein [Methanosarcinaceae archaeon]